MISQGLKKRLGSWLLLMALFSLAGPSLLAEPVCLQLISMLSKYVQEDLERGVHRFSETEQEQARLRLLEGRYRDSEGRLANFNGLKMFVADQKGHLVADYRYSHQVHHSSLAAGQPVSMAGWLSIKDGVPQTVFNGSGHYQPSLEELRRLIQFWRTQNVPLDHLEVGFRVAISSSKADTFYYALSVNEFFKMMNQSPSHPQQLLEMIIQSDLSLSRKAKAAAHLWMVNGSVSEHHFQLIRTAIEKDEREVVDDLFDLMPSAHFDELLKRISDIPHPLISNLIHQHQQMQRAD